MLIKRICSGFLLFNPSKPTLYLPTKERLLSYLTTPNRVVEDEPLLDDEQHLECVSVADRSYWTKRIHKLCALDENVREALRLLDRLRLLGYSPDSLNISSVIHALCKARRYGEAHQRFVFCVASGCVPNERTCNVLIARLLDAQTPLVTLRLVQCLTDVSPEFVPSLTNYNRLIDCLCKRFELYVAHKVLVDMLCRGHYASVVSYTTLISGYCRYGDLVAAFKVFAEMYKRGVLPNSMSFSVLASGVFGSRDVECGRKMMDRLWECMKSEDDPSVKCSAFANLVDSLCREGLFHEVFRIAEDMPKGSSVCEEFAYSQMVDSLCRFGRHHGASRIVYMMRKRGFTPSLVSYNSIIHGLCKDGGCMRAFQLFQEGVAFGYIPSEFTFKLLTETLCQEGDVTKAKEVLEYIINMKNVDRTRMYNIYLRALCFVNNTAELLNTLVLMLQTHCRPDIITLNTVISGLCKMGRIQDAMEVFHDMLTAKFSEPDTVTFTTVIGGLLNLGEVKEALILLHEKMPERCLRPNVVTYNVVLRGLFKLEKSNEAMEIYKTMVTQGINADSTTFTIVIDGLCEAGRLAEAQRFWEEVVWPSRVHDDFVYASILKGLSRSGRLEEACHFLYELVDSGVSPNIFSYNILIDAACKLGSKKYAYEIIGEMKKNGLSPDAITWRILDKLHYNKQIEERAE
ncbi:hypothetical protein vseg_019691 [Gypsophila vaccaria]